MSRKAKKKGKEGKEGRIVCVSKGDGVESRMALLTNCAPPLLVPFFSL